MIENASEQTTPAAAVAALQAQIDALDDAIGQAAGTWRELAADPSRAASAAVRLGDLERQRDILRAAMAEAQQVVEQEQASDRRQTFQQRAAAVRERLEPLVQRRVTMGQELAAAVDRVAELIDRLADQEGEFSRACDAEMTAVSGLTNQHVAETIRQEVYYHLVGQVLARRLGRLWPEQVAPSSFGLRIEDRIGTAAQALLRMFLAGVEARQP